MGWLYADVRDREYFSETTLTQGLEALYEEYNVLPADRKFPVYHHKDRYGLLLFKVYTGSGGCRHIPLVISRENRVRVTRFYNYLSERLPYFVENGFNTQSVFRMVNVTDIDVLQDEKNQRRVFDAMTNSVATEASIASMSPWITYIAFHHRQADEQLSDEVKE